MFCFLKKEKAPVVTGVSSGVQPVFLIRRVRDIRRDLHPRWAINGTRRTMEVDPTAVATMPLFENREVDLVYFEVDADVYNDGVRCISCAEVERQFSLRNLVPDPIAQAKDNEDNPCFADYRTNACQWKGPGGRNYFILFCTFLGERRLNAYQHESDVWMERTLFAGVRKL